jgi:hypothetical protein
MLHEDGVGSVGVEPAPGLVRKDDLREETPGLQFEPSYGNILEGSVLGT